MSEKDPNSPNRNEGIEQNKAPDTKRIGNNPAADNTARIAELHFPASDLEKSYDGNGVPASLAAPEQSTSPAGEEGLAGKAKDETQTPAEDNMEHSTRQHEETTHVGNPPNPVIEDNGATDSTREVSLPETNEDPHDTAGPAETDIPAVPHPEVSVEASTVEQPNVEAPVPEAGELPVEPKALAEAREAPSYAVIADETAPAIPQTPGIEEENITSGEHLPEIQTGRTEDTQAVTDIHSDVAEVRIEPASKEVTNAGEQSGAEERDNSTPEELAPDGVAEENPPAQEIAHETDEEPSRSMEAPLEPANSNPGMPIPPAVVTSVALGGGTPGGEESPEEKPENAALKGEENIETDSQPEAHSEASEEEAGQEYGAIKGSEIPSPGEPAGQIEPVPEGGAEEPASPEEIEQPSDAENVSEVSEGPASAEVIVGQQEQAENEMPSAETGEQATTENVEQAAEETAPVDENVQKDGEVEQEMPASDAGEPVEAETINEVSEEIAPIQDSAEQEEQAEEEVPSADAAMPSQVEQEDSVSGEETGGDEQPEVREEVVDDLAHIIESIIFASDEPLPISTIKSVLDAAHTFGRVNPDMITSRVNALNAKYEADGTGFHIVEIANGFQYATRKEMAQWVSNLFKERSKRRLSNSALETVAIIAYKQPITKPEIESIRGVNVDYVLHNLLEKELVTVVGRAETVGRPLLYGTTQKFLKVFALKSLDDLPKLREIEEIIKEIKSKGAEESIQLEITALGDSSSPEPAAGGDVPPEAPSENGAE